MLHHPVKGDKITITSDTALEAVLEQQVRSKWQPLAFFSCQLRKPERNYSMFGRELLRVHLAFKHFRYFTEGGCFRVYTAHKPLISALKKSSDWCLEDKPDDYSGYRFRFCSRFYVRRFGYFIGCGNPLK